MRERRSGPVLTAIWDGVKITYDRKSHSPREIVSRQSGPTRIEEGGRLPCLLHPEALAAVPRTLALRRDERGSIMTAANSLSRRDALKAGVAGAAGLTAARLFNINRTSA